MSVRNLLSKLLGHSNRPERKRVRTKLRSTQRSLHIESLEGRAVMSTFAGVETPYVEAPPHIGGPAVQIAEVASLSDDDDIKHGTVTVTLQPMNDVPAAER